MRNRNLVRSSVGPRGLACSLMSEAPLCWSRFLHQTDAAGETTTARFIHLCTGVPSHRAQDINLL